MTEMVRFVLVWLAVKVPVGEKDSQVSPVQLVSDTEGVTLVLLCAVTVRVCEAGTAAPATAVNAKVVGLSVRVPAESADVTLRVTFTVWVPDDVAMLIVPVHVVPAAIPD